MLERLLVYAGSYCLICNNRNIESKFIVIDSITVVNTLNTTVTFKNRLIVLSAAQAACWIYGLKLTEENAHLGLQKLLDAELIPVLIVRGDPNRPVAISRAKYDMEPWRFVLLAGNTSQTQPDDVTTSSSVPPPQIKATSTTSSNTSAASSSVILPAPTNPSHTAIMDLVKGILLTEPVEGITEEQFLDEEGVLQIVAAYLPDGTVNNGQLAEWMAKDGCWGGAKRKRTTLGRVSGRVYHLVQEAYRDYSWSHLHNVHQFRRHVRLTSTTVLNIGYVRRSNTKDTAKAKPVSVELQAYKLEKKLLCEKVYGSYNTSASSDLQSRDYTDNREWLASVPRCSGNTQDLFATINDSCRKIRLVTIDFAGFCTNSDHLRHFFRVNKTVVEIVVDLGHKVDVFTRQQVLKDDEVFVVFEVR